MKALFTLTLLFLIIVSGATYLTLPGVRSDKPQLHWIIVGGPEKGEQVEMFYQWLKENNYPEFDLKMDKPGAKPHEKNVIQGISGVAGDILDCYEGHVQLYQSVGLLVDLTDRAGEMGLDLEQTYTAVRPSMKVDGRQYAFPRNVSSRLLWVNLEAFEKLELPVPPDIWTFEEFEEHGKAFVAAANIAGEHQEFYFSTYMGLYERIMFFRSQGRDIYNETLTKLEMEHPIYEEIYQMFYRWIREVNIIPTEMEAKTLLSASSGGVGAGTFHLFAEGKYGMMGGARWSLIQMRRTGPTKLAVSELPHGGFRNTLVYYGAGAVYAGSKYTDLAQYFLKFLASEQFNMHIVKSGDGLPPVAKYTETEEFLRPKEFPNEWGSHERIRRIATEIALPVSSSPYILLSSVMRIEKNAFHKFLSGRSSAGEAIRFAEDMIRAEMKRAREESSELSVKYEKGLRDQAEIDRLREKGELVPLHLISNPFYRRYYVERGWSLPEGDEETLTVVSSLK